MRIRGGLRRQSKAQSEIPSSSLADMAFLLLIFFMVSTTFRREEKRPVNAPEAAMTQRRDEPRRDVLHVYLERDGSIYINDAPIPLAQVADVVRPLRLENRGLVVQLRADRDVPYAAVAGIQEELQAAGALRLVFYTTLEQRLTRAR